MNRLEGHPPVCDSGSGLQAVGWFHDAHDGAFPARGVCVSVVAILHNLGMLPLIVAAILYATCVRAMMDKSRSEFGRLVLAGGRSTLTSVSVLFYFLLLKMHWSMYNIACVCGGLMIAAVYFPWIAADAVDGRVVKRGHAKPPEPRKE